MSKNYIEENKETPIYNIQEADAAQREYCNENDYPFFAPSGGVCWKCNRNIYDNVKKKNGNISYGYSVQFASRRLITGCPHCHWSYCE